ncbi:NAD-dependent epimerase/dehydratase family protein, partial [Candidatus Pelagibacter sp.]|nr:NAD-dependent epimerase/dehydratase family protein [Candidatus Pelagibacter sp.]
MGSKLLITGGLGYIGSFTARKFQKINKFKAVSIDNLSRGNRFSEKFSKNIKLDILNNKIKKVIQKNEISIVFHLASLTCVRESLKKTKEYYKSYQSQIKFINNLKDTNVKYFIFSS